MNFKSFLMLIALFFINFVFGFRIFNMIGDGLEISAQHPISMQRLLFDNPLKLYGLSRIISPFFYGAFDDFGQRMRTKNINLVQPLGPFDINHNLNLLQFDFETLENPNTVIAVAVDKKNNLIYEFTDIKTVDEFIRELQIANRISELQKNIMTLEKEQKEKGFSVNQ